MKLSVLHVVLICLVAILSCYVANARQQSPRYQYFTTLLSYYDGEETTKRAYVSRVLTYPGWEARGKTEYHHYFAEAMDAFRVHLEKTFHFVQEATRTRNLTIISGANPSFKTKAEAKRSLDKWVSEAKRDDYFVVLTRFSFSYGDCK